MRPFYITTPIYYVNDKPHIGHAYTTVAVDVMARYQRLRGRPVRFLTGTDEHGEKIEESAKARGLEPQRFVDEMSEPFRLEFQKLGCAFDDYIRTTEARHTACVQRLWQIIAEKGDIYLGEYEGWYSVADEMFITEKELEELDPVTRAKVRKVREPSYFFRLSAYGERLLELYENNPTFVQPEGRFNEVKSFVRSGLKDLSVSRTSFSWGIPVPGDPKHVMYVWFDALTNYVSALGGPASPGEAPLFDRFWGAEGDRIQVVGKDILRFHAVFWPAFLLSAGLPPPSKVWAHGWLTINGQKMSKRLGNFIPPGPLVDAFGSDVVRYHLMREVAFGQDGDFSHKNLIARYNGELGNGLGNLLNRMVASIVKKNLGGRVPAPARPESEADRALVRKAEQAAGAAARHLDAIAPNRALDAIWELVAAANQYVDQTAPWALAKQGKSEELSRVSYHVLETLRWLAVMVAPFMPEKADGILAQIGLEPLEPREGEDRWPARFGQLSGGLETQPGTPLFPRIDEAQEAEILTRFGVPAPEAAPAPAATKDTPAPAAKKDKSKSMSTSKSPEGFITFDQFLAVQLQVGLIQRAEAVAKSDKLVRLEVDLGEDKPRQILAGIREHYPPEELLGKRVVVVANLPPRKMMGLESQGMVLAASDSEHGLCVLSLDKDIAPGTRIS